MPHAKQHSSLTKTGNNPVSFLNYVIFVVVFFNFVLPSWLNTEIFNNALCIYGVVHVISMFLLLQSGDHDIDATELSGC